MKFFEIERIKKALGLPASATHSQIEARIAEPGTGKKSWKP